MRMFADRLAQMQAAIAPQKKGRGGNPPQQRKVAAVATKTRQQPWEWRSSTAADMDDIIEAYGGDLQSVPEEWLEFNHALTTLRNKRIMVPMYRNGRFSTEEIPLPADQYEKRFTVHFMSLFGGSGNLEQAFLKGGLQVGMWVDIACCTEFQCKPVNVLDCDTRQTIWAFLIVFMPEWVHSGFPCTFWSPLSRFCNRRSPETNQQKRLEALAFVIFTCQVLTWQGIIRGGKASYENGIGCSSHKLDIVQGMVQDMEMKRYATAACAWGGCDPDSGKPLAKQRLFVANWDCSRIVKKCTCPGGKGKGTHQRTIGKAKGGKRTRAQYSGMYESALCDEFVVAFLG